MGLGPYYILYYLRQWRIFLGWVRTITQINVEIYFFNNHLSQVSRIWSICIITSLKFWICWICKIWSRTISWCWLVAIWRGICTICELASLLIWLIDLSRITHSDILIINLSLIGGRCLVILLRCIVVCLKSSGKILLKSLKSQFGRQLFSLSKSAVHH